MAVIGSKWPLLLTTGEKVTPEQAEEIIVRTNGPHFTGNDRTFERAISQALSIPMNEEQYPRMSWQEIYKWYDSIKGLHLHYLNNSQIYSAWIGGPHGWCHWDGTIATGNYNIGKWPSVAEVEEDLAAIAEAFPFLRMRVQLIEDEGENLVREQLCGEWAVADGKWTETEPGDIIVQPQLAMFDALNNILFGCGRERGVELHDLHRINQRLLAKFKED